MPDGSADGVVDEAVDEACFRWRARLERGGLARVARVQPSTADASETDAPSDHARTALGSLGRRSRPTAGRRPWPAVCHAFAMKSLTRPMPAGAAVLIA